MICLQIGFPIQASAPANHVGILHIAGKATFYVLKIPETYHEPLLRHPSAKLLEIRLCLLYRQVLNLNHCRLKVQLLPCLLMKPQHQVCCLKHYQPQARTPALHQQSLEADKGLNFTDLELSALAQLVRHLKPVDGAEWLPLASQYNTWARANNFQERTSTSLA